MTSTASATLMLPYLPPEVFDAIFKQCSKATLKQAALVCRLWSSLTKRHLLSSVLLRSVEAMQRLEKDELARSCVCSLKVDVAEGGTRWTAKAMVNLLKSLPKLESLSLHLNKGSPGALASYRAFADLALPQLKYLEVFSDEEDRNQEANRRILQATPNIRSLSIASSDQGIWPSKAPQHRQLLELPFLTSLKFRGVNSVTNFTLNPILSEATLNQVTKLTVNRCSPISEHVWQLFVRLRGQLEEFIVERGITGIDAMLGELQTVKKLGLTEFTWPVTRLPLTVSAVILDAQVLGLSSRWRTMGWGIIDPKTVNYFEVRLQDGFTVTDYIAKELSWLATQLKMNVHAHGAVYSPDSQSV